MAALFFILGGIVITDSVRLGIGWQEVHGPRPGYFPFYIGLIICIASLVNMVLALRVPAAQNKAFVERGQLKMVLTVLIPTAIYAALVTWIGIYVSSVLFIGFFMRWLGKYPWWKVVAGQRRHGGGVLRHLRDLVQGAAAQGPAGSPGSG